MPGCIENGIENVPLLDGVFAEPTPPPANWAAFKNGSNDAGTGGWAA
jgi:hypothetical protein